jgi:tRNA nucleotidyltransferase (CCA-adding enzyme)
MVGTALDRTVDTQGLADRIAALPGVVALREAAERAGVDAYLVGGAVRDALLGAERADLDVAVVGDHLALVDALGGEARVHDRFTTASVATDGGLVDVAATRAESYAHPGALPEVRPAGIREDLARRDFSVNAIAIPVLGPVEPLDPHGGIEDLREGFLRLLHARSLVDDPTRALRGARYAARLDLEPGPHTTALIRNTDLATVSADRVEAELRKLAAEPEARRGFELLDRWGLVALEPEASELIGAVVALVADEPWRSAIGQGDAVLAARDPAIRTSARELANAEPEAPSHAVELARGRPANELAVARALGAEWLDRYLSEWRAVRLEISGRDLLEAGVPEGPAIGAGLGAALRAKLDGELDGREEELRAALAVAGQG